MRHISAFATILALVFTLVGCSEQKEPDPNAAQPTTQVTPEATGQAGQSGVQVHGAGAGIVAPVTGTENLQGGGGGVNQAAKDRAKQAAGRSGSSLEQLPSDGD